MRFFLALALVVSLAGCSQAEQFVQQATGNSSNAYGTIEYDTDRPGSDFDSFEMNGEGWQACQRACADNDRCMAWTFTEPGVQAAGGKCWLKSAVPDRRGAARMVSGVIER